MTADRNLALFGSAETPPPYRLFSAGPLSFGFEDGAVRHVRWHGIEVIRGIAYLLRDGNWASPALTLGDMDAGSDGDSVQIEFPASVRDGDVVFDLTARIAATADGTLTFAVSGIARSDFPANRIGFSVLHPTPQCQGLPLTIEHLDGTVEQTTFPDTISPAQPAFDIQALSHSPVAGVEVRCELSARRPDGNREPFEMEDQRNWSDASFKTYVGSLLAPLPFQVRDNDRFEQQITLRCDGSPPAANTAGDGGLTLTLGAAGTTVLPPLGLAVPQGAAASALAAAEMLTLAGPGHLCAYLRADDTLSESELRALAQLGDRLAVPIELEIELPCDEAPTAELRRLAARCAAAGLTPAAVLVCPSAYLKSYQPTAEWPDVPPLIEIYRAARQSFPDARIGGGMLSYFTELNRCRPPAGEIDFVSHTLSPLVHAADDLTVMENLTTLGAMAATVRAALGNLEYRLGPTAISMRHNPYGESTLAGGDRRLPMADADPRERGLFGAAWAVGLIAAAAAADIKRITLFATGGPRSVLDTPDHPLPWPDARVRPVFQPLRGLAGLAGGRLLETKIAGGTDKDKDIIVATLAVATDGGDVEVWLANLGATEQRLRLPAQANIRLLDSGSLAAACSTPTGSTGWPRRTPPNSHSAAMP